MPSSRRSQPSLRASRIAIAKALVGFQGRGCADGVQPDFCPSLLLEALLFQLSLSRLNHWLPGRETHPEVVQGTAEFHHQIADTLLPQADPVLHDTAALDTAIDMLDPQSTLVQGLVRPLLLQRELLATGLLRRHEDLHVGQRERQEPQILQEPAPRGQGIRRRVGNWLIMSAATIGVTEKEDEEQRIHEQDIFDRVVLFLPAITVGLFNRVLGADDAPFRPVMSKRGEAGAAAGTATTGAGSSNGVTMVAASVSETPSRCARAVRERVGASPRARSAASHTGRRT